MHTIRLSIPRSILPYGLVISLGCLMDLWIVWPSPRGILGSLMVLWPEPKR